MSEAVGTDRPKYVIFGEYRLGAPIGSGSFGDVFQCTHVKSGKKFAVKRFKTKFPNEKKAFRLREIQILQRFEEMSYRGRKGAHCPFVMKAERIAFENKRLYLVFPLMDMSLTQFIKMKAKEECVLLDEHDEIRVIMRQILTGLRYLHDDMSIMHRDLKPDNIMVTLKPLQIKIIDFGTCKDLTMETGPHTSYVSTRWYRAPECVLRSHHYKFESDVFAVGCIMAELYLRKPLFPGTSELDQLDKIFRILGTPKKDQWKEGYRLAESRELQFNNYPKKSLKTLLGSISDHAEEALKMMLRFSANKRGTASQVLNMHFFVDLVTPSTQDSKYFLSQEPSVSSPHQNYQISNKQKSYLAPLSKADDRSSNTRRAGGRKDSSLGNTSSQSGLVGSLDSGNRQEETSFVAEDRPGRLVPVNNRHNNKGSHSLAGEDFDSDSSNSEAFMAQTGRRKKQGHFSLVREPMAQLAQLPQVSQVKGTIQYRNLYNETSRLSPSNSPPTMKEEYQQRPAQNTFFRPDLPQLAQGQDRFHMQRDNPSATMYRARGSSNVAAHYEQPERPIEIFRPTTTNQVNLQKINGQYHHQRIDSSPSYQIHQTFASSMVQPNKGRNNSKQFATTALDRQWQEITPQNYMPIQQFLNNKEPGLSSLSPPAKRSQQQQHLPGNYIKFPNNSSGFNENRFNRTAAIPKRKEGWTINVSPDRNFIDARPPQQRARQSPAYYHPVQVRPPSSSSSQEHHNEEQYDSKYQSQIQETLPPPKRRGYNPLDAHQFPSHPNPMPGKSYLAHRSGVAGVVPGSSMEGTRGSSTMGPGEKVKSMISLRRWSNTGGC